MVSRTGRFLAIDSPLSPCVWAGDETIVAIAGHVSRRMLSRYAHIRTEAKRKALESITLVPAAAPQTQTESSAAVVH